ncbi:hypothetical protein Sjap_009524 [Stephania japonica]|uniref:non-specific serine/threonine protein kinase n=1 Tax=Stephania japonica TaxID=461633 RepID=A0AAP0JTV6_9MAGN
MELRRLKALSLLGRGAKGIAFLVKDEESSDRTLALKVISKALIEKKRKNSEKAPKKIDSSDHRDHTMKRIWFERDVLSLLDHPLLPKLRGLVVTDEIVSFAMDYCPGGNLNNLRKQQTEKMFSEDLIRFYAAEIVIALEYLHGLGIVYRDLKPENILIQENGHLMVVDFDLSTKLISSKITRQSLKPDAEINNNTNVNTKMKKKKKSKRFSCLSLHRAGVSPVDSSTESKVAELAKRPMERSNSFVGTEEYVSPEIISGTGHDSAVDRWGLGVVIYEMLYGRTPFRGSNRSETFYRILTKEPELVGDRTALRDLIRKLLEKDPEKRISMEEIKGHEFFKGVAWDSVVRISRPPYIPPPQIWEEDVEGIKGIDVEAYVKEACESFDNEEGQNGNCDDKIGGKWDHKKATQTQSYKKDVWRIGLSSPIKTSEFSVF